MNNIEEVQLSETFLNLTKFEKNLENLKKKKKLNNNNYISSIFLKEIKNYKKKIIEINNYKNTFSEEDYILNRILWEQEICKINNIPDFIINYIEKKYNYIVI